MGKKKIKEPPKLGSDSQNTRLIRPKLFIRVHQERGPAEEKYCSEICQYFKNNNEPYNYCILFRCLLNRVQTGKTKRCKGCWNNEYDKFHQDRKIDHNWE